MNPLLIFLYVSIEVSVIAGGVPFLLLSDEVRQHSDIYFVSPRVGNVVSKIVVRVDKCFSTDMIWAAQGFRAA